MEEIVDDLAEGQNHIKADDPIFTGHDPITENENIEDQQEES